MTSKLTKIGAGVLLVAALTACSSASTDTGPQGRVGPGGGQAQSSGLVAGGAVTQGQENTDNANETPENVLGDEAPVAGEGDGKLNDATSKGSGVSVRSIDPEAFENVEPAPGEAGSEPADLEGTNVPAHAGDGNLPFNAAPAPGARTWVAYIYKGADTAALGVAEGRILDGGWSPQIGAVSCDGGAAEALNVDPNTLRAGVYFETQSDAQKFASHMGGADIVQVTANCQDLA